MTGSAATRAGMRETLARIVLLSVAAFLPTAAVAQSILTALPSRSATLERSLGSFDDPVLAFSRISRLLLDTSGRLYILQPVDGSVTVLNPDGTLHQRIGRKGRGPGEFLAPAGAGWRGDTLWVMDAAQDRLSFFYEGNHVHTDRFVPARSERSSRIAAQWPVDGGHLTMVAGEFERPAGDPDNYLPIIRTADNGEERQIAALKEHFPFRLVIRHADGVSHGSPLFSDFPLFAASDSGERFAILDRPFAELPEARIRLTVLEASGDTAYSRSYRIEVERLTDDQWNERLRDAFGRVEKLRSNLPFSIRDVEKASRRPAHWPSVTQMVVGSDLSIWIALAELPWRDEREWAVLDPDGNPRFKVSLPKDFQLHAVSGNVLWGVRPDEYDVPHVERYRIGSAAGE